MKELNPIDPLEIVIESEQKKTLQRVHTFKPHKGHKMFKWDGKGLFYVTEDDYETSEAELLSSGDVMKTRKLKAQPQTSYVSALNQRNAIKKLLRMGAITNPNATS